MSLDLPLELQQRILLLLDTQTFYSAARTCRSWRKAALAPYVLLKQLQSTHMADSLPKDASDSDLVSFFHWIARQNLLGFRIRRQRTYSEYVHHESLDRAPDSELQRVPKLHTRAVSLHSASAGLGDLVSGLPVWSQHGILSAELRGLDLTISLAYVNSSSNEDSPSHIHLQLSPSIFPRPGEISKAKQWFVLGGRLARYQVALSEAQDLVAVALGNKVHIYPVKAQTTSSRLTQHVEYTFQGTSLNWVQSLEFAESDTLLRCEINRGGAMIVQYRGLGKTPQENRLQGLAYWKLALGNIYLASDTVHRVEWFSLRSIRLLPLGKHKQGPAEPFSRRPIDDQKAFAALIQRCGNPAYGLCKRLGDSKVASIQWELPSRPGHEAMLDNLRCLDEGPRWPASRWDPANLPLARSFNPIMAVSDDGFLLAIFEPRGIQSFGALYVCSLATEPCQCKLGQFSGKVVPGRWPLLVGPLYDDVISVKVSLDLTGDNCGSGRAYSIQAQTYDGIIEWSLESS